MKLTISIYEEDLREEFRGFLTEAVEEDCERGDFFEGEKTGDVRVLCGIYFVVFVEDVEGGV